MKNYKGIRLLHKYLNGKPTFEDKAKVEKWYEQIDESKAIANADELLQLKEKIYQGAWDKLKPGARVIPMYKKSFFRIAAAAVLAVGITSIYFLFFKTSIPTETIAVTHSPALQNNVAAPADNKAILTLADGSSIALDSAGSGSLATQGNVIITKLTNGKIAYNNNSEGAATIQFNTLTVPKGSKPVQLVLADGSEVWLNVASSITYPTAFTEKERKVKITGEAYFEIATIRQKDRNTRVPFIVSAPSDLGNGKDVEIHVLGTHFNVDAYNDENSLKVTLLEGSVKVGQHGGKSIYIQPDQQAELNRQSDMVLNKDVDTDEVMAWKNNWFNFNSMTVPEIMRQIEKWYGISVSYAGKISDKHFSGIVSRSNNVSEVLKIMEQAGIKFKIEGKKITVM